MRCPPLTKYENVSLSPFTESFEKTRRTYNCLISHLFLSPHYFKKICGYQKIYTTCYILSTYLYEIRLTPKKKKLEIFLLPPPCSVPNLNRFHKIVILSILTNFEAEGHKFHSCWNYVLDHYYLEVRIRV